MHANEQSRFNFLRNGPCVPAQYVQDYYGLSWPLTEDLRHDLEAWRKQLRRPFAWAEGAISRYELESFMQRKSLVPKTWIGAKMGMNEKSIDALLPRLNDIGMRIQRYVIYPGLIADSLSEDLVQELPGLRLRTFSNHDSFCLRLHDEIRTTLQIEIQPLYCATSEKLQDHPRHLASHFDCITLDPLSVKHQMWLDFGKPLNLAPDRCSKLFYAENKDALQPFCAGSHEPDGLDRYLEFLTARHNV